MSSSEESGICPYELLKSYEERPITLSPEELAKRHYGIELGKQLNRLQGHNHNELDDRIAKTWANGQVSHEEYIDLCLRMLRQRSVERSTEQEPYER